MTRARSNRSGFEQRLLATLRELGDLSGQRLSLAFSGGSDSLALAFAFARVAPLLDLKLRLIHVDHRLRPASPADAASCRELAEQIGLPLDVIALDPDLPDRITGVGLEEAARRERYLALAGAASGWDSRTIVLGHQANDQAETVLMHLFRGAGLDGLAGMRRREARHIPWWGPSEAAGSEFTLLRPLLTESRASIDAYIESVGLQPVNDESNKSDDFDRNWVRHHVLPTMLERWPSAIETIGRSSQALELDRRLLEEGAASALRRCLTDDSSLSTDKLAELAPAILLRVLRDWLRLLGIPQVSFDVVASVNELFTAQDQQRLVEVGGGVAIVFAGEQLMTLDSLLRRGVNELPLMWNAGPVNWIVEVADQVHEGDVALMVPAGIEPRVRTVEPGDRWFGTRRPVMEDLRSADVHPLLRNRMLAVVADDGVLLIPAIYPTIRTRRIDGPTMQVGVRWNKRS